MRYDWITMLGIFLPVPLTVICTIGLVAACIRSRHGRSAKSKRIWSILLLISVFWLIGSAAILYGLAHSIGPEFA